MGIHGLPHTFVTLGELQGVQITLHFFNCSLSYTNMATHDTERPY